MPHRLSLEMDTLQLGPFGDRACLLELGGISCSLIFTRLDSGIQPFVNSLRLLEQRFISQDSIETPISLSITSFSSDTSWDFLVPSFVLAAFSKRNNFRINRDFPELLAPTKIVIGASPSSANTPGSGSCGLDPRSISYCPATSPSKQRPLNHGTCTSCPLISTTVHRHHDLQSASS